MTSCETSLESEVLLIISIAAVIIGDSTYIFSASPSEIPLSTVLSDTSFPETPPLPEILSWISLFCSIISLSSSASDTNELSHNSMLTHIIAAKNFFHIFFIIIPPHISIQPQQSLS